MDKKQDDMVSQQLIQAKQKKGKRLCMMICLIVFFVVLIISAYRFRYVLSDYCYEKADFYYTNGFRLEQAARYYQWALLIRQQTSYAHYQLARIELVQGNVQQGLQEIDKELTLFPDHKRAYYIRGLLNGYAKNYAEAEQDFQRFIEYAPKEWAGYVDLSWVYLSSGQYDKAITTVGKGLELHPDNPWLYSNKGLALYKLGKYEEAKDSLETAKQYAAQLTPKQWKLAYPGNNPADAQKGVKEINAAISYNLSLTYKQLGDAKGYLDEHDRYQSLLRQ